VTSRSTTSSGLQLFPTFAQCSYGDKKKPNRIRSGRGRRDRADSPARSRQKKILSTVTDCVKKKNRRRAGECARRHRARRPRLASDFFSQRDLSTVSHSATEGTKKIGGAAGSRATVGPVPSSEWPRHIASAERQPIIPFHRPYKARVSLRQLFFCGHARNLRGHAHGNGTSYDDDARKMTDVWIFLWGPFSVDDSLPMRRALSAVQTQVSDGRR